VLTLVDTWRDEVDSVVSREAGSVVGTGSVVETGSAVEAGSAVETGSAFIRVYDVTVGRAVWADVTGTCVNA
jgi:hypothetical protein